MNQTNDVLNRIPRSGLRSITEKAQYEYSQYSDLILLGYGQPIDPPSEKMCEAIADAGRQQLTQYTPNQGTMEFREAVVCKMKRIGVDVSVDEVFTTPGATYGIAMALGCILNPGDEVLVPDPGYPNFSAIVQHYSGVVSYYTLDIDKDFKIDVENIRSLANSKTKAIIVNTPSNPTGAVQTKETIIKLVTLAEELGIWLVCDEVYDELVYGTEHYSPLSTGSKNVVSLFSLSKTYNLCGLRIGYTISRNKMFQNTLLKAQEFYISCASSVSQHVGVVALRDCQEYAESLRKSFEHKVFLATRQLGGLYNIQGAFYVMVRTGKQLGSSLQLSLDLLEEEHVAVAPGITFGPSSDVYFRISLIANSKSILEGITRIKQFLRRKYELVR